jgi:hypothetical protein
VGDHGLEEVKGARKGQAVKQLRRNKIVLVLVLLLVLDHGASFQVEGFKLPEFSVLGWKWSAAV